MRKIQILSTTPSGTLLFKDNEVFKEGSFEGFRLNTSIQARHLFAQFNSTIECSVSKNNKVRYRQVDTLTRMLQSGILTVIQDELAESKAFSKQEKSKLRNVMPNKESTNIQLIDLVNNRHLLPKFSKLFTQTDARVVYLAQDIVVRVDLETDVVYLPLKLQKIDHYFELQQYITFAKFISDNHRINVRVAVPKFNLVNNRFECEATLDKQVEEEILRNGWGTVCIRNICKINSKQLQTFKGLQNQARSSHSGIFKRQFELLNLVYTKDSLMGIVEQILQGYIFKIRKVSDDQELRIQLHRIGCPISCQRGAFQCRQFIRKHMIGREVSVQIKKDSDLNVQGSIVILLNNKDVQSLMIENGFGYVKEQFKGTIIAAKLEALEKKAKEKRIGLHSQQINAPKYENFSILASTKDHMARENAYENRLKFLQRLDNNTEGVIEKILDGVTYLVRVDKHNKIIRMKLQGVMQTRLSPKLPEIKQIKAITDIFTYRNFLQRSVHLSVTEYKQATNNFSGVISLVGAKKEKISFQELLLRQGLVYLRDSSDKKMIAAEKIGKDKGINIWVDKLQELNIGNLLEKLPKNFYGKISWVENGCLIYVQPFSMDQKLIEVSKQLNSNELQKVDPEFLVPGHLCASEYEGEKYRANIISVDKNKVELFFIDWGNREKVEISKLYEIPQKLHYIVPLCAKVELDKLKPFKLNKANEEQIEKVRQILIQKEVKVTQLYGNICNAYYQNKLLSNFLINKRLVKPDKSRIPEAKELMMPQNDD